MHKAQTDLEFAVSLAMDGQKWLLYKWETEYGYKYPAETRSLRIKDIQQDIDRLKEIMKSSRQQA